MKQIDRKWLIKDGKLSDATIAFIKNSLGQYELIFRKLKRIRTIRQNKYYWAYLNIIEKETGNDSNELHEYFKRIFLQPKLINVLGHEIKIPGSTTKLSKLEFSDYIAKIEVECGIPSPDPNELYVH
jgi:hypothetical protein